MHAQGLQDFAAQSYLALYEDDDSVVDRLGKLQREAERGAGLDPSLEEIVKRLGAANAEGQDVGPTVQKMGQRWEADPERLEEVEQRLQLLRRLETKYRKTIDELIVYHVGLDEQERRLQQEESDLSGIEAEMATVFRKLKDAAAELSKARQR